MPSPLWPRPQCFQTTPPPDKQAPLSAPGSLYRLCSLPRMTFKYLTSPPTPAPGLSCIQKPQLPYKASPSPCPLPSFHAHSPLPRVLAGPHEGTDKSSHPPGLLAHPILLQPTAGPPSPVMTNIRISLRTSAPGGSNTPAHRGIITCHREAQEDDRPHDT